MPGRPSVAEGCWQVVAVLVDTDMSQQNQSRQSPAPSPAQSSSNKFSTQSPAPPLITRNSMIARKPLPPRPTSPPRTNTMNSESSYGNFIDETAFAQIVPQPHLQEPNSSRLDSLTSTAYDDGISSASPGYSSTGRSVDTIAASERPRAGVLRTVGNAEAGNCKY